MRLTCTACGAHGSIEQFTSDADARMAFALGLKLPNGLGAIALRYIALFRPVSHPAKLTATSRGPRPRGLTWDRVCKLLTEIAAMVEAGHVERRGKLFPASAALFASAMQQMLDQRERLDLPLQSHGYLVAIIAGDSPREAAQLEAQAEAAKREQSRKRAEPEESLFQRQLRKRLAEEAALNASRRSVQATPQSEKLLCGGPRPAEGGTDAARACQPVNVGSAREQPAGLTRPTDPA